MGIRKKFECQRLVVAIAFALVTGGLSESAAEGPHITAVVPIQISNFHPDVRSVFVQMNLSGYPPGSNQVKMYARCSAELEGYNPKIGGFDGEVELTVDLTQIANAGATGDGNRCGRVGGTAFEDLNADMFTDYRVSLWAVNFDGEVSIMQPFDSDVPEWAQFEETDTYYRGEIFKD